MSSSVLPQLESADNDVISCKVWRFCLELTLIYHCMPSMLFCFLQKLVQLKIGKAFLIIRTSTYPDQMFVLPLELTTGDMWNEYLNMDAWRISIKGLIVAMVRAI